MKIRLVSDVHHEFYEDERLYESKGEDVLVIAGDLNAGAIACQRSLRKFRDATKAEIIYVPGNHEYYGSRIGFFDGALESFCGAANIHFLNPGFVYIDGVSFIGATLWTGFQGDFLAQYSAASMISDFSRIREFDTVKCAELYADHSAYIRMCYEDFDSSDKKVIVTHFLPAVECISEQYRGPNLLNKYFANDLGDWISYMSNTTWLFGHTHDNVDVTIGETRCIANPYGYKCNDNYVERLIEV